MSKSLGTSRPAEDEFDREKMEPMEAGRCFLPLQAGNDIFDDVLYNRENNLQQEDIKECCTQSLPVLVQWLDWQMLLFQIEIGYTDAHCYRVYGSVFAMRKDWMR